MYRASAEIGLIDRFCPEWAKNESHEVKLAIAEGRQARAELTELRTALACLKRLVR